MDQDPLALFNPLPDERHAAVKAFDAERFHVRRRQVEHADTGRAKMVFVIAILLTKVDDGPDAVTLGQLAGTLDRETPAHRQAIGQPVKVYRRTGLWIGQSFSFNK
jgi:hypothetical protein